MIRYKKYIDLIQFRLVILDAHQKYNFDDWDRLSK